MSITTIKLMAMTLTNSEELLADIFMNVSGASATGMRTLGQSSSFMSWFGLECSCTDLKCTRCSFKLQNLNLHDESDDVNDDVIQYMYVYIVYTERKNNTWARGDWEFLFECSTRHLTSECSERE